MNSIKVDLSYGTVEGVQQKEIHCFFSIPYAAPLTNERRFKSPAPPLLYKDVLDATRPRASAPQNERTKLEVDLNPFLGFEKNRSFDYLTLNIFAPAQNEVPAPVMVFVHGGSFVSGSKDAAVYNGRAFARDGIICVTINYRLGIEGFLPLDGGDTNIGLRDIIASLKWIHENISAFGGNPKNITLFGQSAGAFCVSALMTSPAAKHLFHRAICQSGHVDISRELNVGKDMCRHAARHLCVPANRDGFLSVSIDQMLATQAWMMTPEGRFDLRDGQGRNPSFGLLQFLPFHGDEVLPRPVAEAFSDGWGREKNLLIGSTKDEANLFFVTGGLIDLIDQQTALEVIRAGTPKAEEILTAYALEQDEKKPGYALCRAITDAMFRIPTRRMAETHQGSTWVYEFDWKSTAIDGKLGAAHGLELPFVFDTLNSALGHRSMLGEFAPQSLARLSHSLWVEFARDGVLPWKNFSGEDRQVYSIFKGDAQEEQAFIATDIL